MPDLLLISAITVTLILEPRSALIGAILAGVFKDAFSTLAFPLNTILFVIWYFLILKLNKQISIENDFIRLGLVLVITFLHHLILGFTPIYLGNSIPLGIFIRTLFIESIYTTAIAPIIFKFFKLFLRRKLII